MVVLLKLVVLLGFLQQFLWNCIRNLLLLGILFSRSSIMIIKLKLVQGWIYSYAVNMFAGNLLILSVFFWNLFNKLVGNSFCCLFSHFFLRFLCKFLWELLWLLWLLKYLQKCFERKVFFWKFFGHCFGISYKTCRAFSLKIKDFSINLLEIFAKGTAGILEETSKFFVEFRLVSIK